MQKVEIPDYRASICASFARGNVGRAIELASNEVFDHMKSSVLGLLKHISELEINQIAAEVKRFLRKNLTRMIIWICVLSGIGMCYYIRRAGILTASVLLFSKRI